MEFDWDDANVGHIALHGLTPEKCEEAWRNQPLVVEYRERSAEKRQLCLGATASGRLLTLVVTGRNGRIRVLTAHPMHAKQKAICKQGAH